MKSELEIKRIDGSRVKITVGIILGYHNDLPEYKIQVWFCPYNKRKFTAIDISDDYRYRRFEFNSPEREQMELGENLKYVSLDEIYAAKIKLWELIKPTNP